MIFDNCTTPPDFTAFLPTDFDFCYTLLDTTIIMPTDFDFDLRLCNKTYFSKCHLFVVLLPLNVYFLMLICIHYFFTLIDFWTSYLLTYTVKVILKPLFFSMISVQIFSLHAKFSGHLNVSFVQMFTGVIYPKTMIAFRAFKYRLLFTCMLYLPYDLFHERFSNTLRAFKCLSFFHLFSWFYILTYYYVFVCKI